MDYTEYEPEVRRSLRYFGNDGDGDEDEDGEQPRRRSSSEEGDDGIFGAFTSLSNIFVGGVTELLGDLSPQASRNRERSPPHSPTLGSRSVDAARRRSGGGGGGNSSGVAPYSAEARHRGVGGASGSGGGGSGFAWDGADGSPGWALPPQRSASRVTPAGRGRYGSGNTAPANSLVGSPTAGASGLFGAVFSGFSTLGQAATDILTQLDHDFETIFNGSLDEAEGGSPNEHTAANVAAGAAGRGAAAAHSGSPRREQGLGSPSNSVRRSGDGAQATGATPPASGQRNYPAAGGSGRRGDLSEAFAAAGQGAPAPSPAGAAGLPTGSRPGASRSQPGGLTAAHIGVPASAATSSATPPPRAGTRSSSSGGGGGATTATAGGGSGRVSGSGATKGRSLGRAASGSHRGSGAGSAGWAQQSDEDWGWGAAEDAGASDGARRVASASSRAVPAHAAPQTQTRTESRPQPPHPQPSVALPLQRQASASAAAATPPSPTAASSVHPSGQPAGSGSGGAALHSTTSGGRRRGSGKLIIIKPRSEAGGAAAAAGAAAASQALPSPEGIAGRPMPDATPSSPGGHGAADLASLQGQGHSPATVTPTAPGPSAELPTSPSSPFSPSLPPPPSLQGTGTGSGLEAQRAAAVSTRHHSVTPLPASTPSVAAAGAQQEQHKLRAEEELEAARRAAREAHARADSAEALAAELQLTLAAARAEAAEAVARAEAAEAREAALRLQLEETEAREAELHTRAESLGAELAASQQRCGELEQELSETRQQLSVAAAAAAQLSSAACAAPDFRPASPGAALAAAAVAAAAVAAGADASPSLHSPHLSTRSTAAGSLSFGGTPPRPSAAGTPASGVAGPTRFSPHGSISSLVPLGGSGHSRRPSVGSAGHSRRGSFGSGRVGGGGGGGGPGGGDDLMEAALVAQLTAALADKARLSQENDLLTRQIQSLQELLEYAAQQASYNAGSRGASHPGDGDGDLHGHGAGDEGYGSFYGSGYGDGTGLGEEQEQEETSEEYRARFWRTGNTPPHADPAAGDSVMSTPTAAPLPPLPSLPGDVSEGLLGVVPSGDGGDALTGDCGSDGGGLAVAHGNPLYDGYHSGRVGGGLLHDRTVQDVYGEYGSGPSSVASASPLHTPWRLGGGEDAFGEEDAGRDGGGAAAMTSSAVARELCFAVTPVSDTVTPTMSLGGTPWSVAASPDPAILTPAQPALSRDASLSFSLADASPLGAGNALPEATHMQLAEAGAEGDGGRKAHSPAPPAPPAPSPHPPPRTFSYPDGWEVLDAAGEVVPRDRFAATGPSGAPAAAPSGGPEDAVALGATLAVDTGTSPTGDGSSPSGVGRRQLDSVASPLRGTSTAAEDASARETAQRQATPVTGGKAAAHGLVASAAGGGGAAATGGELSHRPMMERTNILGSPPGHA